MAEIIRAPSLASERRTLGPGLVQRAEPADAASANANPPGADAAAAAALSAQQQEAALRRQQAEAERQRLREQEAQALKARQEREKAKAEQERERLDKAYADAQASGYEAGCAQGRREAQAALADTLERLANLVADLDAAAAAGLASLEDATAAIAFEAVCKILGEAAITREGVLAQVRQVMRRVRERGALAIHLHPADLALLHAQEVSGLGARATHVDWVADDSLAMGGCIVKSAEGELEAQLDFQLEQLKSALAVAHRTVVAQRDE